MPTEKILDWLKKTGFPLEMGAAAEFRRAGFDVKQSSTYADPQSDKGREIDVLATDPDIFGVIDISFVVECKASPKPWVVFTSEDALSNYNRLFAFAVSSDAARKVLTGRAGRGFGALAQYIDRPTRGGYGFRQAFGKDSDPAHSAAVSVLNACHGISEDREGIPRLAFAFPVIVVDSALFECSLDKAGADVSLREVDQSDFLFSVHIPQQVGCCIRVVRRNCLSTFTGWAKNLANAIRAELKPEEEMAFAAISRANPEGPV
jgi:hypothetical protein